jgi:hypothetical protein
VLFELKETYGWANFLKMQPTKKTRWQQREHKGKTEAKFFKTVLQCTETKRISKT